MLNVFLTVAHGRLDCGFVVAVNPGGVIYVGEVIVDVRKGLQKAEFRIENHEVAARAALAKSNPALAKK